MKRVFLVVLDSVGAGALPDAAEYGDVGANTLGHVIAQEHPPLPNMEKMGLGLIPGVGGNLPADGAGAYGRAAEVSAGKDTTTGHWEITGLKLEKPFPTADSVFQIACHEDLFPPKKLYELCEIARNLLQGEHAVGRVIARPFTGPCKGQFSRTPRRRDYSIEPAGKTVLNALQDAGVYTMGIGKIEDIFCMSGLAESDHAAGNPACVDAMLNVMRKDFTGLCFVNLVDFDSIYGHRRDVKGYSDALVYFDKRLDEIKALMTEDDLLILTADHGCDPAHTGTDHTREYVPILAWHPGMTGLTDLGTRKTYADIAATIADVFGLEDRFGAESFANLL